MRNVPKGIALFTVLFATTLAFADTVVLKDGRRFVGEVTTADGKVTVQTAAGPKTWSEAEVLYTTPEDLPAPPPETPAPQPAEPPEAGPQVPWDPNAATLPEPLLYMTMRQIELLPPGQVAPATRAKLRHWQAYCHERRRKFGTLWLDREERRRRREAFASRAEEAGDALRRAKRRRADDHKERVRQRREIAQARAALIQAAKTWPDQVISEFLVATQELDGGEYAAAQRRFQWCIRAEPLVTAFHQGRGMALLGLKLPLKALEEFETCLKQRDDTLQTMHLLKTAMLEVPGRALRNAEFLEAKALLERYEPPAREYRPYRNGTRWLMPGREWTSREGDLPTPPYERIICRTALAVPITEDVLVTDTEALAGALAVYVQATPGEVVRATPPRTYGSRRPGEVPLTLIRAHGAAFTPVEMEKSAPLTGGVKLTIHAVNAYRQMGAAIRRGQATVASAGEGGVKLEGTGLLPGERVGAAFAGERFAGFLTARIKLRGDQAAASEFVDPEALSEWAGKAKSALSRYRPSSYSRGPKRKEDAPLTPAPGRVFVVYILCGEKPLPKALK